VFIFYTNDKVSCVFIIQKDIKKSYPERLVEWLKWQGYLPSKFEALSSNSSAKKKPHPAQILTKNVLKTLI
jgi:hypothetical protein